MLPLADAGKQDEDSRDELSGLWGKEAKLMVEIAGNLGNWGSEKVVSIVCPSDHGEFASGLAVEDV